MRVAAADAPHRADEVAEAVDREHGRLVERRDEERAGEVRAVVLDEVQARAQLGARAPRPSARCLARGRPEAARRS